MDLSLPCRNVPNVKFVRRDVEIAAKQDIFIFVASFVEESTKPLQPVKLEMEFIAPKLAAVRNVRVHDTNPVYRRRDQAFRGFVVVIEVILLNILDRELRDDGDAVV